MKNELTTELEQALPGCNAQVSYTFDEYGLSRLTTPQVQLLLAAPALLRLLNSMCAFAYAVVNPAGLTEDYHEAMALIAELEALE